MSKDLPLVSVVIPCFNQGKFIDEAVQSVLASAYRNIEIIIVNDGSTEERTKHILQSYSAPKTTVIETENNGVSAARNTAIQAAKGKYILPLDADDKIAPTYLEKAVSVLESDTDIGLVYCEAALFGTEQGKWKLPKFSIKSFINGNCIFISSLFRKSVWEKVGGFKENMLFSLEDWDFWISIIETGSGVYQIPEILFFYRKHAESRTIKARGSNRLSFRQIILNHSDFFAKHALLLKGLVRKEFFSKSIRKQVKTRCFYYFMALIKYRLFQLFGVAGAYLLFPIYVRRIYEMLAEERK